MPIDSGPQFKTISLSTDSPPISPIDPSTPSQASSEEFIHSPSANRPNLESRESDLRRELSAASNSSFDTSSLALRTPFESNRRSERNSLTLFEQWKTSSGWFGPLHDVEPIKMPIPIDREEREEVERLRISKLKESGVGRRGLRRNSSGLELQLWK